MHPPQPQPSRDGSLLARSASKRPASVIVRVRFAPEQPQPKRLGMNNQELIRTLNRDHLLSVVELLSRSLMCPGEDFQELSDELFFCLCDEVLDYSEKLTDYQRLKLMQLIINTLIHESEQSTQKHFQTLLPLKTEG